MDKKTGLIIVFFLIVFITIRVYIAMNVGNDGDPVVQPELQVDLPAVYTGTLPCASCPGIDTHFLVRENGYRQVSWFIDRENGPFTHTGEWTTSGDTLIIKDQNGSVRSKLLMDNNRLFLLGENNQQITGELEENYILRLSDMENTIREKHREFKNQGVEFLASGNEPFWSVRQFENDSLLYITPENEMRGRVTDHTEEEEKTVLISEMDSESADQIKITIQKKYCRDSMSGFLFTHTVSAEVDNETLQGCGRYL